VGGSHGRLPQRNKIRKKRVKNEVEGGKIRYRRTGNNIGEQASKKNERKRVKFSLDLINHQVINT
jgi:hypothetical protein